MTDIYAYHVKTLMGRETALAEHRGEVLLIVNTASQCGFTPQYAGLDQLHRRYRERGFSVLGFPCNQFGGQEPENEAAIGLFCSLTYGVSFPLFAKIHVNGAHAHPLFTYLKRQRRGLLGSRSIKWNFTKFLVDRSGRVAARRAPSTPPSALAREVEALL